ncbi:MAG: phospholipid carrier-dependent glycosyltransferase [Patescibacteria group bacterium]
MKRKFNPNLILILILLVTAFLRLVRLDFPNQYVFDEVYHAYTAKEYLKGNKDAWSPWGKSEPGVAFEWLHPPIEKEIMTASMFLFRSTDAWAWRLPGVLLGILAVYLVYKLAHILLKNEVAALFSSFFFSVDGLVFVQSRTGMNDVYLVTFVLASVIFFLKKKYLLAALLMGVACATKWPGVFLAIIYFPFLLTKHQPKKIILFILVPLAIYLLSYLPYFLLGYKLGDFIELHRQIWWYQTNLKATHDYASAWWSWPLNLYPVWYFVDYKDQRITNIFASGNLVVFWTGTAALILTIWETFRKKSLSLFIIVLGFLVFWLPWSVSPRIMFLYHFSPSVPFLTLALGHKLSLFFEDKKHRKFVILLLILMITNFVIIYPFLIGIPIHKDLVNFFFLTNLSKNPF